MKVTYDKILGCLVGGAAGDALGYPIEFEKEKDIFHRFGSRGIEQYILSNDKALISDDTQMTLFTAAGLLLANRPLDYNEFILGIETAYREWLTTQKIGPIKNMKRKTWLAEIDEMYHRRDPGITCIASLGSKKLGSIDEHINQSKGNGGVMRVAPIGLFYNDKELPLEEIDYRAAQAAALTHGHPLGYISSAGFAHVIYLLTHETDVTIRSATEDMLIKIPTVFPKAKDMCEVFCSLMRKAVSLSDGNLPDRNCIHILGKGEVGEEALAIAIFCCLRHPDDFDAMVRTAVNHDGDSDSTGSIAGNILGAYLGYNGIPSKYIEKLELLDVIKRMSTELYKSTTNRCKE